MTTFSTASADDTTTLHYGSWPSPITAASIEEGARGMGSLALDGDWLYWLESRPEEGGRVTIVRWHEQEGLEELLPAPWNVRTRVHEYGGRSMLVADGVIWFSNFGDQRIYRFEPGKEPVAITPELPLRYAACELDRKRDRLICVREDHRGDGEPVNTLVALPVAGMAEGEVLFEGSDFVSAPSVSPDGAQIAFIAWNHPNMPWDNTTLWQAELDAAGKLANARSFGDAESLLDPQWDDQGRLHVISDRSDWWSLYRVEDGDLALLPTGLEAVEVGGPAWSLGSHFYHFLPDGRIALAVTAAGQEQLYLVPADGGAAKLLDLGSAAVGSVAVDGGTLYTVNYTTARPSELVAVDLDSGEFDVLRRSKEDAPDPAWIPAYRAVTFPTADGAVAHGFYYPPTNPRARAPADTAPPLMVTVHGGPTSATSPTYSLSRLYWTSRGFAVLDLNYRGSTGFGRAYRRALYGEWGVADVEDALAGARWAAEAGLADPEKLVIRGGSAGGYTTLAAHAMGDTFAAGTSLFGISDIEALARDTHKFESRYLDQLIGPYPEAEALYKERSPINHLDGFAAPLLMLQGLEDRVVPPNQSEMIFEALKSRGIPTAYVAFEGEGHGFRKSENAIRAREAELYFYGKVLGFPPAEELPAIDIVGLDD